MKYDKQNLSLLTLIALTIVASGCISNSSANLDQDFNGEYTSIDTNISGESLLNETFSSTSEDYDMSSKTQLLFNTPVTSFRLNLTSEGVFQQNMSETTSVTRIGLGAIDGENKSDWAQKTIKTSGNSSTITVNSEGNQSSETVDAISDEELGVSIEAFKQIGYSDVEVLGATGENQSGIALEIEADNADLAQNYENIFKNHAVNEDEGSSMEDGEEVSQFNQSKTYAVIDRDAKRLESYSYFGSAANGSMQVRVDADFNHKE
ncbi:hypothetical protein [Candidatus Nanohalobium constans]|uniref:Uncharacterized protein n=1 Tax=Candidatus Nanohalobium constans TaxID=2565781 RepID=A0A5Q0UF92_9ARCH|nr:hypothetical protein [Candidatus Nanohalobium constans]QGA80238.1 hypothetical protein LC1Nh_0337 [Candidatus Nanohalobium constans]